jgi:hypothetical protein
MRPLLDWLERVLNERTVQLVAARMRISLLASVDPPRTLCAELEHRVSFSFDEYRWDVLDAIDYLVQVDWDELWLPDIVNDVALPGSDKLSMLQRILVEGGSAYHVSIPHQRLERRVDETAAKAFERSATVSGDDAGRHLRGCPARRWISVGPPWRILRSGTDSGGQVEQAGLLGGGALQCQGELR